MRAVPAAALIALLTSPAIAGERERGTVLMPEASRAREFHESWGFAQAVIAGDTIYLSGIVADRREDEQSFEPAYERVYAQVASILKRAGASWDDVIDLSSFHTDVEAQIRDLVAVHKRHVKAPYPAWTAIGVAKILGGGVTEIKVVAKRPRPGK